MKIKTDQKRSNIRTRRCQAFMPIWLSILLIVLCAIISGVVCFLQGVEHRKKIAEAEIGSAETEARRIVDEAVKEAEAKKKEIVLEGKDEVHQFRNETEKDLNSRRKEIQRQERRMQQKEETLDKKLDNLEKKEENVAKKLKQAEEKLEETESIKVKELEVLERLSGFTSELHITSILPKSSSVVLVGFSAVDSNPN